MQFLYLEELNNLNFNYNYIKKSINIPETKKNIIKLVIKYIFIINLLRDINTEIIFYKFS